MRIIPLLTIGGLGVLTACAPQALLAPAPLPVPVPVAVDAAQAMGQLVLTIAWPRQVQTIPYSTNQITVSVSNASGSVLAATTLQQPTGLTTSQAQLSVPAGTSLNVDVKGYQNTVLLAEGTAIVSVATNERTPLSLSLNPVYVPTIQGYAPNGGAGALVALTGANFGASRNTPVSVTFGGVTSPNVYRTDDTHLSAEVPTGVASGAIVVQADGVSSAPSGTFWVLSGLSAISPAAPTLTVGSSVSLSVTASDVAGTVSQPYVQWAIQPVNLTQPAGMASGSFSAATGSTTVFTAAGTGSAVLIVKSGTLVSTTSLTVQ